jgi:pimeloyl-ACP methyl ester carboxylesterase
VLKNSVRYGLAILFLSGASSYAEDSVFDSKGVKIRYVTEGKGDPVVLIHGWMSDSSMWGQDSSGNTKLKGLDGFQVIALDCRGHGKSDKPHEPGQYGLEMAADVIRLLDHLKLEKAHLVGYSSGAFIAGNVAATHPTRVISVIYGGQAPLITRSEEEKKREKELKSAGTNEVEIFAKAVDEGNELGSYLLAVWPANKPKVTEEQANALAKFMYGNKDVKAFAAAGRSFGKLVVTREQLKTCKAPVLFIHGGNESDYVKEQVSIARKQLEHSEWKVIKGGDHVTTLAKPEFGTAIIDFLKANKIK